MLSVFITPWMNPTSIHCATSAACASRTVSKKRERGHLGGRRCGRMTVDRVVEQPRQHRGIVERCGVLEGADTEVTGGDTHEHRAGLHRLANDPVAGRDDGEAAGRRNPQRVHRLAHQVLAQHRAEHGEPVATAGEGSAARALQVQVAARAVGGEHLAEQERPAVAETRRVPAELMAGVRLGNGLRTGGHRVADEHVDALGRSQQRRAPIRARWRGRRSTRPGRVSRPESPPTPRTGRRGRGRTSCRRRNRPSCPRGRT